MFNNDNKNKDRDKKGISPIMAGVTGAVMGAGVAVAATQALKDKKTRSKLKQTISAVKDQTLSYVENFNGSPALKQKSNQIKKAAKTAKKIKKNIK